MNGNIKKIRAFLRSKKFKRYAKIAKKGYSTALKAGKHIASSPLYNQRSSRGRRRSGNYDYGLNPNFRI